MIKEKEKYKEVPISAGEKIAKDYDKQEVIIISVDREHNKVHMTTYGTTKYNCKNAEITGAFLSEVLELDKPDVFLAMIEQAKEHYFARRA